MKTLDSYQNDLLNIQSNLLNYAYFLTSNREDAYRLLNDTTSIVIDNKSRFDRQPSLKECALAVMRVIYQKKFSSVNHSKVVGGDYDYRYHLDLAEEPAGNGAVCIEESRLRQEISTLGEPYAKIYSLYIAGYTDDEIAGACSLSREAVADGLSHACRRMASAF